MSFKLVQALIIDSLSHSGVQYCMTVYILDFLKWICNESELYLYFLFKIQEIYHVFKAKYFKYFDKKVFKIVF